MIKAAHTILFDCDWVYHGLSTSDVLHAFREHVLAGQRVYISTDSPHIAVDMPLAQLALSLGAQTVSSLDMATHIVIKSAESFTRPQIDEFIKAGKTVVFWTWLVDCHTFWQLLPTDEYSPLPPSGELRLKRSHHNPNVLTVPNLVNIALRNPPQVRVNVVSVFSLYRWIFCFMRRSFGFMLL